MYTLFKTLTVKQLVYEQAPTLVIAWIVAELFYKFHSFTLECAAFLATWFILDVIVQWFVRPFVGHSTEVDG